MAKYLKRLKIIALCFLVCVASLYTLHALLVASDFRVSYSGTLNGEFSGTAMFSGCAQSFDSPLYPKIRLQDNRMMNGIAIILPVDASPGKHSFSRSGTLGQDYMIGGTISQTRENYYSFSPSDLVSGSLSLKAVPHAPEQSVRGSFEALFRDNASGHTLVIKGEFDFKSGSDTSYDCLK